MQHGEKSCPDTGMLGAQREIMLAIQVGVPGKDCNCTSARGNKSEKAQQKNPKTQKPNKQPKTNHKTF